MAVSATLSNHAKLAIANKEIDFDDDHFHILLVRDGFVFDKDYYAQYKNVICTSGAIQINVDEPTGKFSRLTGSFISDGFVPGNSILGADFANAGNNASFVIDTVSALEIVVTDNTGMVTETGGGNESLTSQDEMATGSGYTRNTHELATTAAVQEDDTNNRASIAFDTPFSVAAGGGDFPACPGALVYDVTADVIIGYLNFDGDVTITDGNDLAITVVTFRLA